MISVVIPCRAEFDILWVIGVLEADFCCCVETTDDVVEVVDEIRVGEEGWCTMGSVPSGWMGKRKGQTFEVLSGVHADEDRAIQVT